MLFPWPDTGASTASESATAAALVREAAYDFTGVRGRRFGALIEADMNQTKRVTEGA